MRRRRNDRSHGRQTVSSFVNQGRLVAVSFHSAKPASVAGSVIGFYASRRERATDAGVLTGTVIVEAEEHR